jgi:hypothetical protein
MTRLLLMLGLAGLLAALAAVGFWGLSITSVIVTRTDLGAVPWIVLGAVLAAAMVIGLFVRLILRRDRRD